ncbi:pentapeptide repeat-containing protein [Salibacter halophilus]|uniref:Pentapeptide repeat-containing protein n=1 Tax=Salibacter halophilus TaxID=1803916 RepID=A0A6N6M5K7_9FLAO|nr:pentapeptide repeat-containing protein [Salibacter halophilus]KAB1064907.1 pentapeptide repeat-containing protein [Salibacter halophilus]
MKYIEGEVFEGTDFSNQFLEKAEYEFCTFTNCNFSHTDLSGSKFIECSFTDCNFSNAVLKNASFQDLTFSKCKMLGLHFEDCNKFGFAADLENCQLDHSSFFKMNLSQSTFRNCRLHGSDFTEAELTKTVLTNSDLLNAVFDHTNLELADLRESVNYSIDPEQNKLNGAVFSLSQVGGLLEKYQIKIEQG